MGKPIPKYDEEFKKSIVSLHQNGKSQSELNREYGISTSALHTQTKTKCDTYVEISTFNQDFMQGFTCKQKYLLQTF